MDEQTKRTMLKVSVSDDLLIFRTVSRQKKSPRLYVQRDELSPLYEGKRVVLNDGPYFCVISPLNRDGMMRMEFYWISPTSGSGFSGWQQALKISRERFLYFLEDSKAEYGPKEWNALSDDAPHYPRLIFRKSRSLRQVMNNGRIYRKLMKFLRTRFQWPDTDEIVLYGDFEPYSFFFREYRRGKGGDLEAAMCGGVILHGQEDMKTAYYFIHT